MAADPLRDAQTYYGSMKDELNTARSSASAVVDGLSQDMKALKEDGQAATVELQAIKNQNELAQIEGEEANALAKNTHLFLQVVQLGPRGMEKLANAFPGFANWIKPEARAAEIARVSKQQQQGSQGEEDQE